MNKSFLFISLGVWLISGSAMAAEPVYDEQNHKTAKEIKKDNESIKDFLEKVNNALKGSRRSDVTGFTSQNNFSIAGMSGFGSLLSGGDLNFSSLGLGQDGQNAASSIINNLGLVSSIASSFKNGDKKSAMEKIYGISVNVLTSLSGVTEQTSKSVKQRKTDLENITGKIGDAEDMKGSIDQNSAIQAETGKSINELIGVQNSGLVATTNSMQEKVTQRSTVSNFVKFDEASANPFRK